MQTDKPIAETTDQPAGHIPIIDDDGSGVLIFIGVIIGVPWLVGVGTILWAVWAFGVHQ